MEKRLIKACLIFFCNNENIAFFVEYGLCLTFLHPIAVTIYIHTAFGVFSTCRVIWVFQAPTKSNHNFYIIVIVAFKITLNFMIVTDCRQPGRSNYHHLSTAADFLFCDITESFYNNSCFLLKVVRM